MTHKLCTYFFTTQKLKKITDSAVAILPVSVRLIDKPVNRKISVNRLTVNITSFKITGKVNVRFSLCLGLEPLGGGFDNFEF